MYDDPEMSSFSGLILNGGAEMSLGKTNLSFNISPLIAAGSQDMKFRIGSNVTIRRILEKQPRKRDGFLQKLGIGKKKESKKTKKKIRRKPRSEEHTSELQSRGHLVCRLLLEKKKKHMRDSRRK